LADIDLNSIEAFGEAVAASYMLAFEEAFALLERHPHAGRATQEFGTTVRCLMCRQHRIFHAVDGDLVLIIRILHHARDVQRALRKAAK
jgi:toxin ParE1/3/4